MTGRGTTSKTSGTLIIVATVTLLLGAIYVTKYFITQDLDRFARSDEEKERFFSAVFPSRSEIESYYTDATFLLSDPPNGNDIFYFSRDGRYVVWHADELKRGNWSITPLVDRRIYHNRQKFDLVYSLCRDFDDGSLYDENCSLITNRDHMIIFDNVERAEGDLFRLNTRKHAPFKIPTSEVSLGQIQAQINH